MCVITELKLSELELKKGDNDVTVNYTGKSDSQSDTLELEIKGEPDVNFNLNGSLNAKILLKGKLANKLQNFSEPIVINVKKKPPIQTPVIFRLNLMRGNKTLDWREDIIYI